MDHNFIEYSLITVILFIEIFLFITTWLQIGSFKRIFFHFPVLKRFNIVRGGLEESNSYYKLVEADDTIEGQSSIGDSITLIEIKTKNLDYQSIVKTINDYLLNNRGALIDYHIIKEIVNQKVETSETLIDTRIPSPLYFGLAGTMIGIIFGLFKMDFELNSIDGIKPLIDGVKIAMIASVVGLLFTTTLSIFIFKSAKAKVEQGKSDFLSFVQSQLLPIIIGPDQAGVISLSNKLDDFGRNTTQVVVQLNEIVLESRNQVLSSQELLRQIEHLDLKNITTANLKVFKELDRMIDSFQAFQIEDWIS